ncbi:alpha/beta hydrolase family protein [Gordonia shandongensis]|uniref:alpha/beta hydrolase family protein n=1 Tax=Gordonia shandongensis TaxID=376351 RepID=UPI00146AD2E5|nr:alpha/beta hydrolase [Gordonia shandongensis]
MSGRRPATGVRAPARVGALLLTVVLIVTGCSATDTPPGTPAAPSQSGSAQSGSAQSASQSGPSISALRPGSVTPIRYPVRGGGDPDQNYGVLHLPRLPGWNSGGVRPHSVPVVAIIHGGGWLDTIGAGTFERLARDLASSGVAVWNIEYRRVGSGGGWPTTFSDVASAVDFVAELGRRVPQLDTGNVTAMGHSAGGQLAAFTAARQTIPPHGPGPDPIIVPRTVIALAASLDMVQTASTTGNSIKVLGGPPTAQPDRYRAVNPIQRLNPRVPMILVHARNDRTVRYRVSEDFAAALRRAGGRVTLRPLARGGHAGPVSGAYGWDRVRPLIVAAALGGYRAAVASPWHS